MLILLVAHRVDALPHGFATLAVEQLPEAVAIFHRQDLPAGCLKHPADSPGGNVRHDA
jgi:hypothetical protein